MHRKFDEDLAAKEERLASMQAEMRAQLDQVEARCKAAIIQQDKMQLELTAAYEQIEHKAGTIARLEQTLSADTARLEKKLHAQVFICVVVPCYRWFQC
jgi:predicted transcriptional regulator